MKDKIRRFLSQNKNIDGISDDDDLFENGFVNSLFALQLIMFIEKEYKIRIPDEKIKEDNFRSVNAIINTVSSILTTQ